MKEHLELEKSYALLQAKTGASHIDPQRDSKVGMDIVPWIHCLMDPYIY